MADRERPGLWCGEWHADGTLGDVERSSRPTVMGQTRALGEAFQGDTELAGCGLGHLYQQPPRRMRDGPTHRLAVGLPERRAQACREGACRHNK